MARKPTPDILAQEGVAVLDAILSATPAPPSWEREIDYPIDRIKVGKRLRPLGDIKDLAASIQQVGLLNAITLLPDGTLVAGRHRLAACQSLGWTKIRARIRELDDVDAELAEIDENLRRSELTVLEQAEHLLRREELLAARGQRASAGDNQHTDTTTTADIAGTMGISERSAQQRLQIARNLTPEARDQLRGTDLAESTTKLLELSRQPQQYQAAIVAELLAHPEYDVARAARFVMPYVMSIDETFDRTGYYARVSVPGGGQGVSATPAYPTAEEARAAFARGEYSHEQHTSHLNRRYLAGIVNDPSFDLALRDAGLEDLQTVWEWRTRTRGDLTGCNRIAAKLRRLGYDAKDMINPATAAALAAAQAAAQAIDKPMVEWTEADWAAYKTASTSAPVSQVTNWKLFALANVAYSAQELGRNKIRQPFKYNGALWICTGSMGTGAEPHAARCDCLRVHPAGEPIAPGERISGYLEGAYQPGTPVECGSTPYTLGAQWMVVTRGHDISLANWNEREHSACTCKFGTLTTANANEQKTTDGFIVGSLVYLQCDTCGGTQTWEGSPDTGWKLTRSTTAASPEPTAQPQPAYGSREIFDPLAPAGDPFTPPAPAAIDPADWSILQPITPANDRNSRIDSVAKALGSALAALGDYEDITGRYTDSAPLRRQLAAMLDTLEANRL